jgi:hypothetical protein
VCVFVCVPVFAVVVSWFFKSFVGNNHCIFRGQRAGKIAVRSSSLPSKVKRRLLSNFGSEASVCLCCLRLLWL